ncbi:HEAT repeat domain-containing protein [Tsuneonella sp. HG094]
MAELYRPTSDFLEAVAAEEVPLFGSSFADANFQRLIAMTRDDDRTNRDWATLLLSQQEVDTPQVRDALIAAAQDEDDSVRAEALLGLAQRNPALALPFARIALMSDHVTMPVFEAVTLIADPSLVELLRPWTEPSEDDFLDNLAREALAACEQGKFVDQ